MTEIEVHTVQRSGERLLIEVSLRGHRYDVTVSDADAAALAGDSTPEKLVAESFRYLLEREPASSILPRFDLSVIEGFFPGYRAEIAARLKR